MKFEKYKNRNFIVTAKDNISITDLQPKTVKGSTIVSQDFHCFTDISKNFLLCFIIMFTFLQKDKVLRILKNLMMFTTIKGGGLLHRFTGPIHL